MDRAQARIREIIRKELIKTRARNPSFSLRAFARKLRLAPSALSEILTTERRVTTKMAEKILYGLGMPPAEALPLIKSCQSEAQRRRNEKVAGQEAAPVEARPWDEYDEIDSHTFELIAEWHHFAILSLLETRGAQSRPEWIAQRLALPLREVRSSLEILERIGLLERKRDRLVPSGRQLKTKSEIANEAVRYSHFQNLELARRSLERDSVEERHFTALTIAVNTDKLEEVRKRIFAFHGEISKLVEVDPKREVYRLVVQLFPLSKPVP